EAAAPARSQRPPARAAHGSAARGGARAAGEWPERDAPAPGARRPRTAAGGRRVPQRMPVASESLGTRSRASGSAAPSEAEDACPVPCRLFLPVVPAARVIGKGGASLKAIRESSRADVRVLQKELPREMQAREDRVVVVEAADAAAVRAGIIGVLERVFDRSGLPDGVRATRGSDRPHVVELLVPEKSGSHFIGQRGERIKGLIEETGCDIFIGKDPMPGLADQKKVRVTGASVGEAAAAVWRLQEVLAELAGGGVLRPEHFELREGAAGGGAPGGPAAGRLDRREEGQQDHEAS
ncbi:unnamed protein product, partial [Prorocentrum cordatum]